MNTTLCLIRQDPARGGLLRAVGSCLAAGLLMRLVPDISAEIADLNAADLPGGFNAMYLLFTALVATLILGANAWTRSSRLALGLPISTRQAWAARTSCLAGVALLSVVSLATALGLSIDSENGRLIMSPVVAAAGARAAATALLLVCIYQLPQSEHDRIPISPPYVVYVIGATLFTLVISSVQILSLIGTSILFSCVVALGLYLYLRLPLTFSAGPTVEESQMPVWTMPDESDLTIERPALAEAPPVRRNPAFVIHWTLFRGLKGNVLIWIHLVLIVASATVVTLEFFDGTNAFLPLFFLMIYFLPVLQGSAEGMASFDPLPIPRRVLWAHGAVPAIAAALLGTGIGIASFMFNPIAHSQIVYSDRCVQVPWEYLELSRDGRVPTVTSAWGEDFTPRAHPLWSGRPIALFNPYESGPESSPRFTELQMRRAVEAVYGIPVPTALLDPDYEASANITGGVERGAFTLEATRGRVPADRSRTAAVATLLLTALTTALMVPALLQYGHSLHRKLFKRASIGCVIFLVVLAVAVAVARLQGLTEVWYWGALTSIGIRSLAQVLPLPTSILWILCVTSWFGAYLLMERIFCSIEFPREKTMNRFAEEY
jgi:hypothetical protein